MRAEAGRGWPHGCLAGPALRLLPEYGPVRLLLLLPVDDTGEEPEGLGTWKRGAELEEKDPLCLGGGVRQQALSPDTPKQMGRAAFQEQPRFGALPLPAPARRPQTHWRSVSGRS